MNEFALSLSPNSAGWAWLILLLASLGTFLWRGLGVLLSGKINQDGLFFRWITCVTYAMVAALVIRIIVLPVGLMAQVPMSYRIVATGAAFLVMISHERALVPALSVGTGLIMLLAWLG